MSTCLLQKNINSAIIYGRIKSTNPICYYTSNTQNYPLQKYI